MRKKMGFFQKFLGNIGKRLFWARAEKINLYVLALMARETVVKYQEIYNGDLEAAVNTLKAQFAEAARSYLMMFMGQIKLIMSKDLKDMEILSKVALWSILGKSVNKYYEGPRYFPPDDPLNKEKIPKFITTFPKCLLCPSILDLDIEKYKDLNYGELIFNALASLFEMILDSMGYNYKISYKETKCFLRGDPYGEIVYFLHEKIK